MEKVPPEFWWLGVCLSILMPAGSALGAWLLYKVWPVFTNRSQQERENRQRNENAALEIAKESIQWSRKEFSEQHKALEKLGEEVRRISYQLKNEATEKRLMVILLTEMYEETTGKKPNLE